jgi:hypothetical protein
MYVIHEQKILFRYADRKNKSGAHIDCAPIDRVSLIDVSAHLVNFRIAARSTTNACSVGATRAQTLGSAEIAKIK